MLKHVNLGVNLGPPSTHVIERGEVVVKSALDGGVLGMKFVHQIRQHAFLVPHGSKTLLISCLVLGMEKVVGDRH